MGKVLESRNIGLSLLISSVVLYVCCMLYSGLVIGTVACHGTDAREEEEKKEETEMYNY